jgi:hypothetical protein
MIMEKHICECGNEHEINDETINNAEPTHYGTEYIRVMKAHVLATLETLDGKCLDTEQERDDVAQAIAEMLQTLD